MTKRAIRHKGRKILILVLAVLFIVAAVVGWSLTHESTDSSLRTIVVGYQPGSAWDIIKSRGTFAANMKKEGYRITFKQFQNGPAMLESVATGDVDYAPVGDTPPISSLASGVELTYVAAENTQAKNSEVLVGKDSGIDSLADLKGKKVAYTKGSSSQYMVFQTLKKAGLGVNDITWVNLTQDAAAVAFANGSVDAWATWAPMSTKTETSGTAKVLVNGEQTGADNRHFIIPSKQFAKNNQDVTKLLITYGEEEMEWINDNHTEVIDSLAKILKVPKKAVRLMVERQTFSLQKMKESYVDEEQKIADEFYDEGILAKKVDISKHVDYLD